MSPKMHCVRGTRKKKVGSTSPRGQIRQCRRAEGVPGGGSHAKSRPVQNNRSAREPSCGVEVCFAPSRLRTRAATGTFLELEAIAWALRRAVPLRSRSGPHDPTNVQTHVLRPRSRARAGAPVRAKVVGGSTASTCRCATWVRAGAPLVAGVNASTALLS